MRTRLWKFGKSGHTGLDVFFRVGEFLKMLPIKSNFCVCRYISSKKSGTLESQELRTAWIYSELFTKKVMLALENAL